MIVRLEDSSFIQHTNSMTEQFKKAVRKTIEMLLNKIETIEVNETVFGRTLGYGTIVVIGTGGTPEPFDRISHPLEFRSRVQQQIEGLH